MDRSLYPSSVEVDQPTLDNTEDTKAHHIKQRWMDAGNSGIADGCAVTVGANPIQVNVAAGRAYAPNNELIIVPETGGLGLSVYTAGTLNYVCAVYGEEESRPAARAFDGRTSNTRATGTARLRVLTRPEISALPTTHTDMSVDAQDRLVILAVVTAQGTAVPLTTANIELPPPVSTFVIGLDQPQTVTGVVFTAIDQLTTQTRNAAATPLGRLSYDPGATPPSTATLAWRSPDGTTGTPVAVATDGDYTLTSATTGATLDVRVYTGLLPLAPSTPLTEDFEVYDVYGDARYSAADHLHRARQGTLAANRNNPHAQRVGDLGDPIAEISHAIVVGTDLTDTPEQAQVPRLSGPQNTNDIYNLWWEMPLTFGGLDQTVRVYSNAFGTLYVTSNARWDGTNWNKDEPIGPAGAFVLGSSVTFISRTSGSPAPWTDGGWTAQPFSLSATVAMLPLRSIFGANLLATAADALLARAQADFATSGRTLLFASQRASTPSGTQLRIYRAVSPSSGGSHALEFVFNASWDDATSWTKDDAAAAAVKVSLSAFGGFGVRRRAAASSSPFTDATGAAGWDDTALTTSILTTGGMQAENYRANGSFIWTSGPTFFASVPGPAGLFDNTTDCAVNIGNSWNVASFFSKTGTGSAAQVFYPLRLPDGAVIGECRIYGSIAGAAANGAVVRTAGTGSVESLDAANTAAIATTTGIEERSLVVDQNEVVNNDLYTYGVWIELPAATTANIYRVEVEYTQFVVTS